MPESGWFGVIAILLVLFYGVFREILFCCSLFKNLRQVDQKWGGSWSKCVWMKFNPLAQLFKVVGVLVAFSMMLV